MKLFSLPPRPDRLWDLPSLLSTGYRVSILGESAGECVELYLHSPYTFTVWCFAKYKMRLHDVVVKPRDNFIYLYICLWQPLCYRMLMVCFVTRPHLSNVVMSVTSCPSLSSHIQSSVNKLTSLQMHNSMCCKSLRIIGCKTCRRHFKTC
jgi:hypothetical protein